MMRSQDYQEFMRYQRQKIYVQSKRIGLEMAQHFNNKRIKNNRQYQEKRKRFENEIRKLDVNVSKWNTKFYIAEQGRPSIGPSRIRTRLTTIKSTIPAPPTYIQMGTSEIKSLKARLQNVLISLINPILYKSYVKKIKTRKKSETFEDQPVEGEINLKKKDEEVINSPFDEARIDIKDADVGGNLEEIKEEEEIDYEEDNPEDSPQRSRKFGGRTKTLMFYDEIEINRTNEEAEEEVNFKDDQQKKKKEYDLN